VHLPIVDNQSKVHASSLRIGDTIPDTCIAIRQGVKRGWTNTTKWEIEGLVNAMWDLSWLDLD
jgi:hypothetical protein